MTLKAHVTYRNFFRIADEQGYDKLPALLQKAYTTIAEKTSHGKNWSLYTADEDFKKRCNMSFKKLREFVNGKYIDPQDRKVSKTAPEDLYKSEETIIRLFLDLEGTVVGKDDLHRHYLTVEQMLTKKSVSKRSPFYNEVSFVESALWHNYVGTDPGETFEFIPSHNAASALSFALHAITLRRYDAREKINNYKRRDTLFGTGSSSQSDIPEIQVSYDRSTRKSLGNLSDNYQTAAFIRSIIPPGELQLQEHFVVLYLSQSLEVLGYYKHTKGTIAGVMVDPRIILGVALKSLAVGIIVAHNHPSGSLRPSEEDIALTEKLRKAAELHDIRLIDHLIITKSSYYSFSAQGQLSTPQRVSESKHEYLSPLEQRYLVTISLKLEKGEKLDGHEINRLAKHYELDKTQIKELTELAIVREARRQAHRPGDLEWKYKQIVKLYNNQITLSHRTSQSILLQQYSTPAPIGYLMGLFCGLDNLHQTGGYAFEPSAGNGLLTIAAKPERVYVNEIDDLRNRNLRTQGFHNVFRRDATAPLSYVDLQRSFPAVITNPPFGKLDKPVTFGTFKISEMDHVMALYALETMTSDGRAAVIIGGHTRWDRLGRIQAGKNRLFFNYLYHHYHVADVIPINGHKLYSRQGTAFPTRLILIDGRKETPQGAAPQKQAGADEMANSFEELYRRVMVHYKMPSKNQQHTTVNNREKKRADIERRAKELLKLSPEDLGMVYTPASQSCVVLDTLVPDSMGPETHAALARIKAEVGGSMDNFVRHRLGYKSSAQLCKALSAEQTDAVAMAIYNIEARSQGMIIGDQTGIGKGRVAAAMIRYAVKQGLKPIFLTEKANLFSDIYRDLIAIGSGHLRPFIINARESKTDIKDEDGSILYQALGPLEQSAIFKTQEIPAAFDFVVATYSQFNSQEKKPEKPYYLNSIAKGNIVIMDEAHNSSGSSNTGTFMQDMISGTRGVVFLSATFAKRPDNMPIYAMKTAISDASMTKDDLVTAIYKGGMALQEILASQLVSEGQMIRRERSFEGVEVNYISLDALESKHTAISDIITGILRDIIDFQKVYVTPVVKHKDEIAAVESKSTELRDGTNKAGLDNLAYFSKVFNVINQMLFSIKSEAVAERAIERLKEGKKPVIAFSSTMGSFIEQMENAQGLPVGPGDLIDLDFSAVLRKGLEGVLRYTERDIDGTREHKTFDLSELELGADTVYYSILNHINSISTNLCISPIDVILQKLEKAGYRVAEVTGRKFSVQINAQGNKGMVMARTRMTTNDAFRGFNNNEIDVLMINQSGSTGASAHAIVTAKVPKEEVKQRVMIVLQPELDISTEVQKRGRINRTGQILKPIYDYMVSAIPAEKRLMMMLQNKLKSLDANTTSNQKQSSKVLDVPDFLNKYGDKVVEEYLRENSEINALLDDPLNFNNPNASRFRDDAAHKVSGRVAVLSTKMQAEFYTDIISRYNDYVDYLKQSGDYDLEVEALDLKAETVESSVHIMGKGGDSAFGEDSYLEKINADVLRKPFTTNELAKMIDEALKGEQAEVKAKNLYDDYKTYTLNRIKLETEEAKERYKNFYDSITEERAIKKLADDAQKWREAVKARQEELNVARDGQIAQIEKSANNKFKMTAPILKFFHIGRMLNFPVITYGDGKEMVMAVSLGISVDLKSRNPYAPSAMKLIIAISNGSRYLSIPLSNHQEVTSIMGVSANVKAPAIDKMLDLWDDAIKSRSKNRTTRYMLTGNILQAFDGKCGKLVSYTTTSGDTKKGILMPEEWEAPPKGERTVVVPILKALPIISSLTNGSVNASAAISIFRSPEGFRFIMPLSRAKAGDIYLDTDLFPLLKKQMFEKTSDRMQGIVPPENLEAFLRVLHWNHGICVTITEKQLSLINDSALPAKNREPIELPPPEDQHSTTDDRKRRRLELEAKALLLLMQMAA